MCFSEVHICALVGKYRNEKRILILSLKLLRLDGFRCPCGGWPPEESLLSGP
jgi:hypothetical protein